MTARITAWIGASVNETKRDITVGDHVHLQRGQDRVVVQAYDVHYVGGDYLAVQDAYGVRYELRDPQIDEKAWQWTLLEVEPDVRKLPEEIRSVIEIGPWLIGTRVTETSWLVTGFGEPQIEGRVIEMILQSETSDFISLWNADY